MRENKNFLRNSAFVTKLELSEDTINKTKTCSPTPLIGGYPSANIYSDDDQLVLTTGFSLGSA